VALGLFAVILLVNGLIQVGNVALAANRDDDRAGRPGRPHLLRKMLLWSPTTSWPRLSSPSRGTSPDGSCPVAAMARERFLEDSFRDRAFYRISSEASIDNPDQRVSEDLGTFTHSAVSS
jgi:hypothetical protein